MTTVFGNPGSTEIGFLRDWPGDLRYVLGLHESAVVAMADGYAHASGRPVLVNVHTAAGLGQGLGQLVNAYKHNTPMVVLAGQQVRALLSDEPFLGALDAPSFPRPYVKWSCEPARAADVPAVLERAYQVAVQQPRGPVFVSVPDDDWESEAAASQARPDVSQMWPSPAAVAELADALDGSERPGLVVGPGVDADAAVPEVVQLAEQLRAGVWASPHCWRSSFPEDHAQFLGFLPPEKRGIHEALTGHDLVVVLGAPAFVYHVYRGETDVPLPPLYLVSDDEQVLARAREATAIRSGPGVAVQALIELTKAADRTWPVERAVPPPPKETAPISAAWLFASLAEVLPADTLLVEEIPSHAPVRRQFLPVRRAGNGLLSTGGGTLGYGLPAAVGAAIAAPDRPVVAVLGDGSSMYGIQALWTAARERLPITFVVVDNAEYAAVQILAESDEKLPGIELGGLDFTALATGMGCRGYRVERPRDLKAALTAALKETGPTVVHVPVDPAPQPLY